MNPVSKRNIKNRILKLAELKSTGSPEELAYRFEISVRTLKRCVHELRSDGHDIHYCRARGTYVVNNKEYYF